MSFWNHWQAPVACTHYIGTTDEISHEVVEYTCVCSLISFCETSAKMNAALPDSYKTDLNLCKTLSSSKCNCTLT